MTQHGGARPGAGRKKGEVSQAKRELSEMAKDYAEQALQVLVSIANSASASDSARVSAATAILDRGYGKPGQSVLVLFPWGCRVSIRSCSRAERRRKVFR